MVFTKTGERKCYFVGHSFHLQITAKILLTKFPYLHKNLVTAMIKMHTAKTQTLEIILSDSTFVKRQQLHTPRIPQHSTTKESLH